MIDNEQVVELLTIALKEALPIGFVISLIYAAVGLFFDSITGRIGNRRGD